MSKFKTALAAASVGVLMAIALPASASVTNTSAATTSEPAAYGVCANKSTGGLRVLEAGNLAKSLYGACAQDGSENFMSLLSETSKPKTLREQWAADKAAKLPAKPNSTDVAYKNWLNSRDDQSNSRTLFTVPDSDGHGTDTYMCETGRNRTVSDRGHRYSMPTYSCRKI